MSLFITGQNQNFKRIKTPQRPFKRPLWKTTEDILYREGTLNYHVPSSFITDLASVPKLLETLFKTPQTVNAAAALHDFLYLRIPIGAEALPPHISCISRARADAIFYNAMRANKVPAWRALLYYICVRLFGIIAWHN